MKTNNFRLTLSALLTIAALLTGQNVFANTWSVSYSGGKFVITRTDSGSAEIVKYRTVSVSALDGKHFTGVNGSVTFAAGETSKQVSVAEMGRTDVPLRYRYQGAYKLYYDFQVLDQGGALLADYRKQIDTGGDLNNQYYLNGYESYVMNDMPVKFLFLSNGSPATLFSSGSKKYSDISYTPPTADVETNNGDFNGYVLIDDSYDYTKKSATVSPDYLFAMNRAGATGAWHKLVGNKLLASVCFTEKEKDDGYAYVQILIGDDSAAYDEGYDPNGADGPVNTPVNSIYKACFELKKGSGVYSGSGKWIFPHSYDVHNQSEEQSNYHQFEDCSAFYMSSSYLWSQKFRSEDYRAPEFNNAFRLDPDIGALTVRFDCGGSNDDTFGYKDLFVRYGLVDQQAPTVLNDDITVNPGLHGKGNKVTVTVPFSEPVIVEAETRYVLKTSWGDLILDQICNGSNVLSFTGNITADAGTVLTINSLELQATDNIASKIPIKDMVGNKFTGTISKQFSSTVSVDAVYTLSYSLNGGSIAGANPSKYTPKSDEFTLVNPTRAGYVFTGWTGTDLNGATMTVTIPTGSTGNRAYSATWTRGVIPEWGGNDGADGTSAHPFIISEPEDLVLLSTMTGSAEQFYNCYFRLANDIDMEGVAINPIGYGYDTRFRGYFYGEGHVIRNLTISGSRTNNGLFGNLGGTVKDLVIDGATINGTDYAGTIAAYNNGTIRNCFVLNSSIVGNSDRTSVIRGINNSTVNGCHYHNCTVNGNTKSDMYVVSVPQEATVSGDAAFSYAGTNYYLETTAITVSATIGYTVSAVSYTPEGGEATNATDNGDGTWSFAMPAANVTVSVSASPAASLVITAIAATVMGEAKYVTTFYRGTRNYQLPAGALAYMVKKDGANLVFYRIGTESNVIPKGTPVVIVVDKTAADNNSATKEISLTQLDATTVTADAGKNDLLGSDTPVDNTTGDKYVLGISGGVLNFYKLNNTTVSVPAGKAYMTGD